MLDAALQYARQGWHVFPCGARAKTPMPGSSGCKDATTDERTIRAWWGRWPDANIALACGTASGVFAIDIDYDEEKGIDGFKSLKEFPDLLPTVQQLTPRGGIHYLFRTEIPPANKNHFRNGIDIRGEGYYIIVAPSTHPNGKQYAWAENRAPGEIELAEYPDSLRPVKKPPLPWEKNTPVSPIPQAPNLPQNVVTPIIQRARLYLAECEPAVQGQGGHDKLLWASRALVIGFELDDTTALNLLWGEYNPRCVPPWGEGERRDFERKVAEARRTPGEKPAGWLLDEFGLRGDERALEYGQSLRAGLLAPKKPAAEEGAGISQTGGDTPDFEEYPAWLLQPPGLVGEICQWLNDTAMKHQPLLSLGATLAFCGTLFGQKVRDRWNNRTNLYVMGVAPSSAGKEHARSQLKRLVSAAGIEDILGGEDVTSDAAIERRLTEGPSTLFLMDEIGHLMGNIKASSGTGSSLSTILPILMRLYSAAHNTYVGKEYAAQERRIIVQPCACIYGTTTPEKLCEGISPSEVEDGWLGRILLFVSKTNPSKDMEKSVVQDVPKHLVLQVQAWWMRQISAPAGRGDIEAAKGPWQIEVPTSSEAFYRYKALDDEAEHRAQKNQDKGVDKLWLKAGEIARRIGLILAAGDDFENPEIMEQHADYACLLIEHGLKRTVLMVEDDIASNIFERDKQRIFKVIKKAGARGIPKSKLAQKTSSLSKRQRDDHLKDLIEQNKIVIAPDPDSRSGRAVRVWPYPYGLEVLNPKENGKT